MKKRYQLSFCHPERSRRIYEILRFRCATLRM